MTLKIYRAPLLGYVKLCALFQSHQPIQTGVTVWKCSIQVKIGDFLSHVTLKFDGRPWKTIGRYLFYATSSLVHHFVTIGQFKLELHSGNTQFRWKSVIFCSVWPWNLTHYLTIGHLPYATSSFVHHFVTIGEFKLESQSGNDQFGSKTTIFSRVWPQNLTGDFEKQ